MRIRLTSGSEIICFLQSLKVENGADHRKQRLKFYFYLYLLKSNKQPISFFFLKKKLMYRSSDKLKAQ